MNEPLSDGRPRARASDRDQGHVRRRIVGRYLVYFLSVLLVVLALNVFTSRRAVRFIEQQAMDRNSFTLDQYISDVDDLVRGLDAISLEIRYSLSLSSYLQLEHPFRDTNVIRTLEMQSELPLHNPVLDNVIDYFIYFRRLGIVISPSRVLPPRDYYSNVLTEADRSYQEWTALADSFERLPRAFPTLTITYRNSRFRTVPYAGDLGTYRADRAALLFYIRWDRLVPRAEIDSLGSESTFTVFEGDGTLLISYGDPSVEGSSPQITASRIEGEWVTTTGHSSYNGWVYVLRQPRAVVVSGIRRISLVVYASLVIAFVLGVAVSIVLALRSGRPWFRLVELLGTGSMLDESVRDDVRDLLQEEVARLVSTHVQLTDALEDQRLIARASLFARLLDGSLVGARDLESGIDSIGIRLSDAHYSAIVILLNDITTKRDSSQADSFRLLARRLVKECIGEDTFLYDYSDSELVFVDSGRDSEIDTYRTERAARMRTLSAALSQIGTATLCVGGVYPKVVDVSYSFEEARAAVRLADETSIGSTIFFESFSGLRDSYRYSHSAELRLENAVRAGDIPAMDAVLEQVHEENFVRHVLPVPMLRHLHYAIAGTYVRLLDEASEFVDTDRKIVLMSEMESRIQTDPDVGTFEYLRDLLHALAAEFASRRTDRGTSLMEEITGYILEHYSDPMLGLPPIARGVGMSESYVSHFFKRHSGVSVSSFIERKRMESAIRFLKDDVPIKQIVSLTGYNSLTSFSRAFRRANGVSPAEYRDSLRGESGGAPVA